MTQPVQTLAQRRAAHALKQIDQIIQGKLDRDHLKSHIAGFPAMILISGLGQACAFYLSKGGPMKLAFEALESWLTTEPGRPYCKTPRVDLVHAITQHDAATYRLAEVEALAYLDWLKKFAVAFLNDGKETERSEDDAASE